MILLIDDNPAVARAVEIALRLAGHGLDVAASPAQGLSLLAARRYRAILLDLNFTANETNGGEGLACLARILADDPGACVIVITAHSGIRIAVAAMQAGARDFVMKPWRNADLVSKIEAAMAQTGRPGAVAMPPAVDVGLPRLLGECAAIAGVRDMIRRVGPTSAGVIVTGPAGAGRTLAASAVHAVSADAATPAHKVDLRDDAAWHRLDIARGTVILRHPDRLDERAQYRLFDRLAPGLRCLAVAESAVALVPALRRRIATVEIAVPPLRDRGGDALLLARHFARVAAAEHSRSAVRFTSDAEAMILSAVWPDEVRGLALAVERAVLLSDDGQIDTAALATCDAGGAAGMAATPAPTPGFDLVEIERVMIAAALREHRHNVTHAAAALGLSRGALYRRMARHGL
ncbi:MAG: response regulator [Sphingomonas sp.]|jgi:DNA-binding NtrC family response regulator